MKSTDSLDFAVMGLFFAILGLVTGQSIAEAFGDATRFVGICTVMRGALDFFEARR